MTDLDRRFGSLDLLEPTDLTEEIQRRAPLPEPAPLPERPRRRVAAGLVAAAVFGGVAVFAWSALGPVGRDLPMGPTPTPGEGDEAWSWAAEGWTEIPPPPEWRDGAAVVWTGAELLYWGGHAPGGDRAPTRSGYSFDPVRRAWSSIPPSPVAASGAQAVWTGDEVLFFDADTGAPREAVLSFDPERDVWNVLSPAPALPVWGGTWAWTGTDLITVGGGDSGDPENTQAFAMDPTADTWRELPDMPVGVNLADATWTGAEIVVIGSQIDRRNHASTRTSVVAAYDPALESWRRLPDPPVSSQTAAIAWVDGRLIAWEGYSPAAAEYLAGEDRWRSIDTGDLEGGECYAEGVVVDRLIFTWDCGGPTAWFPQTAAWAKVGPPVPHRTDIAYSFGVTHVAGPVAVVEHVETLLEGGGVSIGSPEAPRHLWAWRPPTDAVVPPAPTAQDAENLVGAFLSGWQPGWEIYLPGRATAEVLSVTRAGSDDVPSFADWEFRSWNHHRARPAERPGSFEIPIELIREKEVVASLIFTVGAGTTADGREAQLVIVDVRAND